MKRKNLFRILTTGFSFLFCVLLCAAGFGDLDQITTNLVCQPDMLANCSSSVICIDWLV